MSNPSNAAGGTNSSAVIREGTRVILREITANLHNSPPTQSPRRKSGNEAASIKGEQKHDVKVRFIREFADAGTSGREATTESSLSSASSFQSLTSTLSSKCSSGICVDSSPAKLSDTSYINADISGLDDLISACENIRLTDKTLDCSRDQSFSLRLDGDDLSGDQTFTSAIDRNSLDRTREISEPNSRVNFPSDDVQELDSTRNVDEDEETSPTNAYFECGVVDIVEASRYQQANSELGSDGETFVQCVSNLAQVDPTLDGNVRDKLGVVELAKIDETHENLEILVNNSNADNQKIPDINHDANSTLSLDEFTASSTAALESLPDLIVRDAAVQLKKIECAKTVGRNEVAEQQAENVLDVNVDCPSDLKRFESIKPTRKSEVAEKLPQSVSDVTVDISTDFKEVERVHTTQRTEVDEKPTQLVLDDTVDFPSDLKRFESIESTRPSEIAENPAKFVSGVKADFSTDSKDIESVGTTQRTEVDEKPTQSTLDATVRSPSDLKQFEHTEPTQQNEIAEKPLQSVFDVTGDVPGKLEKLESVGITSELAENPAKLFLNVSVDSSSELKPIGSVASLQPSEVAENPVQSTLDITVDIPSSLEHEIAHTQSSDFKVKSDFAVNDISTVDKHECYKPSTPALSELNDNSQCLTLPTLSSICLRDPSIKPDAPLDEQPIENVPSIKDTIPTVAVPSLSEKFENIAAIDIPHGNSISTIQEPTFLNAQKLVEESSEEITDTDWSVVKSEDIISKLQNVDKSLDSDFEIAQNVEKLIQPSVIEVCELNKSPLPVQTPAIKIASPEPPEIEAQENKIQCGHSVDVDKQDILEIAESHGADSSTGSENLNETVSIQDISAGNIFGVAESDQYAEFLPQQQSTALPLGGPTVKLHKSGLVASAGLISGDNLVSKPVRLPDEYAAFVPQQQSTAFTDFADRPLGKLERLPTPFVTASLPPSEAISYGGNKSPKPTLPVDDRCNFEQLEIAAKAVANDIYNTSLEIENDNATRFVSANSELFYDPESFDFLLSKTPRKNTRRDLRTESLYVKFDPLVSNTNMLPHGNIQNTSPPVNEERNGDNTTISKIGTPKKNPAIAAIDRLLFYSPMTTTTTPTTNTSNIQTANNSPKKVEDTEQTSAETVNMAKELELVRSTVIQLEEQLQMLKVDHEEVLEKQSSYQEKINQLQTQLAQEIKNKNQITVVVDEYEKSISRLVAEKERDRKNLDLERAKLQEEIATAKRHLENSEAAFNDVHQKYERLKAVAAAYKSNEVALKQSAQKNVEIIKTLELRNEQVKEYATAQLEKANQDLDAMLKKHESETVRLNAMVRKAELKSNSLAELVEQKTKENKELTGILDEVIARVGRTKSEASRNFHPDSS